ncbi:Methylcobamide:CoM methyltransferase MtaA [Methanosarcina siciliae T4/M]|uniref:Methylcobamide:CoM methyltransferase MtaA n=1 Tax=Methanosarcina siciliae T4/M TaxID=1434120 RepID=A0A0E3P5R6_9EURY|nr:methylcobamide:CoM methyltransferase MtaA [Methanosarcina siciliae]AKB29035.1 Methylcobamide:CoM methyltransferase MtaA [Methanosarcina siciliae T4/M]
MEKPNFRTEILRTLEGKTPAQIPVGTFTTAPVLELMDLSGAARPEADSQPEKMALLAFSQYVNASFETLRYPFDMVVLVEALGCRVDPGTKAKTPAVLNGPMELSPVVPKLPEDLLERGRIPAVLKATEILREKAGSNLPLIVGMEGPADLASSLCGITRFLKWTIKRPHIITRLIDLCTDACIMYARECLKSGADVVVIADAVSSPDMISPDAFRTLIKPGMARIPKALGGGKSVLHICGAADPIIADMAECGFDGLSLEEGIKDLKSAVNTAHEAGTAVIGSVSTSRTLFRGGPEDVKKEAFICMESGVDILAPGCGLAPETPLRNLKALVEARNEFCGRK